MAVAPDGIDSRIDTRAAAERLAALIRYPTVSSRLGEPDVDAAFDAMIEWLQGAYPAIAKVASVSASSPDRLVFEIPGSDPSLDPILMIAHLDVVDAPPKTREEWTHDPFGGDIDDGYVWGRGAIDDKGVLVTQMEAVETLLASGATFRRGIVLAFGGDEELAGVRGAGALSAEWADRRFHFAMDEGAVIAVGMVSQPKMPVALIGIAEKGHLNVRLRARTQGGHAAMPPRHTAVGVLADAIRRIERNPFPARLIYTVREFFRGLAARSSFPMRMIYSHPRLFWPLLRPVLDRSHTTRAMIRTTQAVTMAAGSEAPNVLPDVAEANINVRILPGDTVASILARYTRLLRGLDVSVSAADGESTSEAVPGSSVDAAPFLAARRIVEDRFDCVAAPYLVTVGTDSKWYAHQCGAIYRFIAAVVDSSEIDSIHGIDERVSLDNLGRMISYYMAMLEEEAISG